MQYSRAPHSDSRYRRAPHSASRYRRVLPTTAERHTALPATAEHGTALGRAAHCNAAHGSTGASAHRTPCLAAAVAATYRSLEWVRVAGAAGGAAGVPVRRRELRVRLLLRSARRRRRPHVQVGVRHQVRRPQTRATTHSCPRATVVADKTRAASARSRRQRVPMGKPAPPAGQGLP
jgi:hypothetical protein